MSESVRRGWHIRLVVGYAVAAAALYFTLQRLELTTADIWPSVARLGFPVALASLALFTLHGVMNALAFGLLVRSSGASTSVVVVASAWCSSVLAKYIPGGVWQVAGRAVILHRQGVGSRGMVLTSILEQMISLSACVGAMLIASRWSETGIYSAAWPLAPLLTICVLGLPWYLPASVGVLEPKRYAVAALVYAMSLIPYAAAYLLLVAPDSAFAFVQSLFEGTVAGTLAVFAPGGLGVRESWVLLGQIDVEGKHLLGLLVLARALIVLSEIVLTLMSMLFAPHRVAAAGAGSGRSG